MKTLHFKYLEVVLKCSTWGNNPPHRLHSCTSLENAFCVFCWLNCLVLNFHVMIYVCGTHQRCQLRLTPSWPSETRTPRCCSSGRSPKRRTTSWVTTCTAARAANKTGRLSTTSLFPKPGSRDRWVKTLSPNVFSSSFCLGRGMKNSLNLNKPVWMHPTRLNLVSSSQIYSSWPQEPKGIRVHGEVGEPSGKQRLLGWVSPHPRQSGHL